MRFGRSSAALPILVAAFELSGCTGSTDSAPPPALVSSLSKKTVSSPVLPPNGWPEDKRALHALSRLAYGPRPGEVEIVARQGVETWIRAQMAPAGLEDAATEAKLRSLPTASLTIPALFREFRRPQDVAQTHGMDKDGPEAREKLREPGLPKRRTALIGQQLAAAKLVRAVESRRQLQEVLVDFWFNHFNVFADKGEDRWMVGAYERDAIRPHVLGGFRDLLGATASHPAMLFYLDNWRSTRNGWKGRGLNENYARELLELHTLGVDGGYTEADVREVARCFTGWSLVPPRAAGAPARRGPAADLEAGSFVYRDAAHDKGEKRVLGTTIPAGGGRADGEIVLDLLVRHPSTARTIATKLCRRFVSDDPPPALVARVAEVFRRAEGDLPSVYAAIFSSPELWSDDSFKSKTKTPLELVASAVRAVGGSVDPAQATPLSQHVSRMGQPLYRCQPPTGFPDVADAWVNAGALLNRLNFAAALAAGRIPGVSGDPALLAHGPDPVRVAALALGSPEFQKR
ncbi:MAG: DUF1800 family protein [Thermoanaerobaculia bacterium]